METVYEGGVLGGRLVAGVDGQFPARRVYCFDTQEGWELPRMCFPLITMGDYLYLISTRGPVIGYFVKLYHPSTD